MRKQELKIKGAIILRLIKSLYKWYRIKTEINLYMKYYTIVVSLVEITNLSKLQVINKSTHL